MKTLSTLTDFFYNELHPDLKKLEEDRQALAKKLILVGLSIGVLALSLSYLIFINTNSFSQTDLAPLLIGGLIFMWAKKSMSKDYTHEFKDNIIHPLIKQIDNNLNYSKALCIPQSQFRASNIFTKGIDRYKGNDLVKGVLDEVKLVFSDVHAQYETRDSKGRRSWHTIFQGLFLVADFNKAFKGKTVILPDTAEKRFGKVIGSWLQSKNMSRDELIKMDSPAFEKHFVVYGTDQIEARYILTHSMMKRLLDYKKRVKVPLHISFVNNHIFLALSYNKDLFEPTVFSSLLKYSLIKEYITTLQLAIGIIEELKLNEKLWSKT
ncbi:MAG: Galanin [Arcobacter sp.]|nr:MAG: Galanin [Arcobacter sp.]